MKGKLIITLIVIASVVVYAYFGMGYMKQRNEHETLASHITDVSQTLAQMPEPPQDLEQRLAAAQASLAAEQGAFPSKMNSTHIINSILKLADDCDVKAIPLITRPWSIENVGKYGYHVFRLDVTVEGSFPKLVSFVSKLENGEFRTLIMEDLSVTRVTEQSEGETVTEGITASLGLAIYTQSAASE